MRHRVSNYDVSKYDPANHTKEQPANAHAPMAFFPHHLSSTLTFDALILLDVWLSKNGAAALEFFSSVSARSFSSAIFFPKSRRSSFHSLSSPTLSTST